MAGMGEQMKMINQMRKLQKELGKEIVEVEAGDGAVVIQFNGELKVVDVKFDADKIDLDNIAQFESWVQVAIRDGLKEAQDLAAEKMKPMMGSLGNFGM